ncbi:MAG TPA: type II secretion system protein [Edaphobacter sp.]|uniref:type II secretion system protein n=1 Tax=Edaphobacter sp. TaxID=1934404 RepID=UPI002C151036|nr:type II secretion system protein [Edaphobacter sp.]HUZ95019.1 type II secretion system protein [Edaphobacter sp.]
MLNPDLHRLHRSATRESEQGFLLLGMVVVIFLILLVLAVAAPRAAHEMRREREVETVHRGNAYVRAIEVYYLKMGNYPTSIDQLEKTNNMRFLRKRYLDPMTGKDDWRVIHLGEAKTTVKGFFGKPLGGIESTSLGGSPGGAGSTGSAFGSSGSSSTSGGLTSSFGSSSGSGSGGLTSSFGSSSSGAGSTGSSSPTGTSSGSSGSSGIGGDSGIGSAATAGPIVGVGLTKTGNSIMTLNEQTTYDTWEFLYDPRIEQLKAKVNLFGGGMTATDASDLGSNSDSKSSFGSSNSNSGTSTGTGSQPSSGGFGSSSFGSGFGSGSSSSPGSSPSPTTNTPQ